jgi:hypothetical protein
MAAGANMGERVDGEHSFQCVRNGIGLQELGNGEWTTVNGLGTEDVDDQPALFLFVFPGASRDVGWTDR